MYKKYVRYRILNDISKFNSSALPVVKIVKKKLKYIEYVFFFLFKFSYVFILN